MGKSLSSEHATCGTSRSLRYFSTLNKTSVPPIKPNPQKLFFTCAYLVTHENIAYELIMHVFIPKSVERSIQYSALFIPLDMVPWVSPLKRLAIDDFTNEQLDTMASASSEERSTDESPFKRYKRE